MLQGPVFPKTDNAAFLLLLANTCTVTKGNNTGNLMAMFGLQVLPLLCTFWRGFSIPLRRLQPTK